MTTVEITFVRHGQTDWNVNKTVQGHCDTPLNETGVEQAKKMKTVLESEFFDVCYSSDLLRAKSTAEIITSLPLNLDEKLRERDYGKWLGQPQAAYLNHKASGGTEFESNDSMIKRIRVFMNETFLNHPNQSVLAVTHGGVMRSIVAEIKKCDMGAVQVENVGRVRVRASEDGWILC